MGWALGAACVVGAAAAIGWFAPRWASSGSGSGSGEQRAASAPVIASPVVAASAVAPEPVSEAAKPPPPALPPFTPDGEFARIVALADPSFDVKVEVPIPRAVIDRDPLRFAITSNRDGYVYVFAVDPANQYLQLFPNALDRDNRIGKKKRLVLPRSSWPMQAGEPVGENHFIAIVSAAPRDFPALDLVHDAVFASLSADAQRAAAGQRTLTASPFAGVPSCGEKAPSCPVAYGAAAFKIEVVRSSR